MTEYAFKNTKFIGLTIAALAPTLAYALDAYPTRTVRIIVSTTPGAGSDLSARILAQDFGKRWNQSVVVANRAGAGTIVGSAERRDETYQCALQRQ